MSGLESEAVNVGQFFLSAIFYKIKAYVAYINNCEGNLELLLEDLEKLCADKDDVDDNVLSGKENLEKPTAKATLWLALVKDLVKDESMKMLMNKDMGIAKVMLRLIKDDLKNLVKDDDEMRNLVVKVMKDIAKRGRKAGYREVSDVDEKDKQVGRVLEKLMEETMEEFKKLMQDDEKMAIAAMHLLENHKEKLAKLTEKDKEVADIMAKAMEMSRHEELLSDNHEDENVTKDDVVMNVNTLRQKVTNLLKPVGDLILNEALLKTLPENVRLGLEAMGAVIGNRRGLKAEFMDSDKTTSHRNCCCCMISYNFFSDRYDMSVAAEAILVKIKDITGNKPGSQDVTRRIRRGEMKGIPTNCVGLKSRIELFQKIIKALESSDVHALGVCGMGGSGKTTLAKEVANSKTNGIFVTTVMVEITESPNIEFIQDQIASGLGLDLQNVHGISEKAIRLYNELKPREKEDRRKDDSNSLLKPGEKDDRRKDDNNSKKVLIVLDNIWNRIDLVQMGIPLDYCKFLLTSREKHVCKAMDVVEANIFEIGLLNEDEAKNLFQFQVQKEVNDGEYKSVADRLLGKCRGLPLSIVATANSLKGKELPFWRQFAEELEKPISCQISGVRHETFSIIRTSYEVMSSEEKKKFFLLACLSPVGSTISIDNLMRYGIGLDLFQHVNKLSEAIDCARIWAKELVTSSMLLQGDSNEYVKIHDIVRESTMSFASKTNLNTDRQMFLLDAIPRWICEETFNKYTGISLLSQVNYSRLNGVKADLLQILLLKGNGNDTSFLQPDFFQGMTNLKVLELLFMNFEKGLPASLCKLKVLKTLHLVECKLGDIGLIGELKNLVVLSLCGSVLEGLPAEIGELANLRLLDMSECECKQLQIPSTVIARLSRLEGLYLAGCNFQKFGETYRSSRDTKVINLADIDELNKLDFLNVLEITILEPSSFPILTQFVEDLDRFQVHVGYEDFKSQPYQRALTVSGLYSHDLEKDMCLKVLLRKADFLSLKRPEIKNIVPELDDEGFRDLTHLELSDTYSIRRICEGTAPTELFLNLRQLEVSDLNNLRKLLLVDRIPHNLTSLTISRCGYLTYIFSEDGGSASFSKDKESDIIELPYLKTLTLNQVSIISVVEPSSNKRRRHQSFFNSKVKLPSLEQLNLYYSMKFEKLWGKESNMQSFQNLKVLELYGCENIETIGPPSMFASLVQLESIYVSRCSEMEQVISEESERQEIPEEIIAFPKLKSLKIDYSESFECFYGGSYKLMFPRLETVNMSCLPRMKKFSGCGNSTTFFHDNKVEFPYLEELELTDLIHQSRAEVKVEGLTQNLFPKLRKLKVSRIRLPSIIFQNLSCLELGLDCFEYFVLSSSQNEKCLGTYSQFPKLEEIIVHNDSIFLQQLVEDDGSTAMLNFYGQLKRLTFINGMDTEVKFLHPFKNLLFLHISKVGWEYLFSDDEGLEQLHLLEELKVEECPNLEVVVRGGDEDNPVAFPRLKRIYLTHLDSMSKFISSTSETSFHFQSLEILHVISCPKLETICPGEFVALRLRELNVRDCEEMQWFFSGVPDQVVELPSLEKLELHFCAAMKCFSTRPVKAGKLRELSITQCYKMEWFLLGNTNGGAYLELPSLENVNIDSDSELGLKCISPAILRAPKLRPQWVTVDNSLLSNTL